MRTDYATQLSYLFVEVRIAATKARPTADARFNVALCGVVAVGAMIAVSPMIAVGAHVGTVANVIAAGTVIVVTVTSVGNDCVDITARAIIGAVLVLLGRYPYPIRNKT